MRKLSTKVLNAHPEIAVLAHDVESKKAALINAKLQKAALEEELKSAKKALKKNVKALPKAKKKGKATAGLIVVEASATVAPPKGAAQKSKPVPRKKLAAKKTSKSDQ